MKSTSSGSRSAHESTSMRFQASMERILAIENAMDVTAVRYKGLHVWPFVRLQLWQRLLHPQKYAPPGTIGLAHMAQALSQSFFKPGFYLPYVESSRRHRDNLAQLGKYGSVDVVFFSRLEDHTERINGRFYNPYLDPLAELIKTRHTYLKLEFDTEKTKATFPRVEHTHLFDSLDYLKSDAQRSLIAAFQNQKDASPLEQGRRLADVLAGTRFDLALTEEYIMLEAERLLHYARYFGELLAVLSPKAVVMTHYHYDVAMALLLACKKQGVTTVNVQQDRQGRRHGMYSNWRHVPPEGYSLLPDYFWCWGKPSAEHVVEGMPETVVRHRALIGGHRWLAKWIEKEPSSVSNFAIGKFEQNLAQQEKVILVTLPETHTTLQGVVLEAIRKGPLHWKWLIRLHPTQRSAAPAVQQKLKELNVHNAEVEKATRYPLYALLRHCDRHVTFESSVAYEALRFGVSSVVADVMGTEAFEEYLARGLFVFAENADMLLAELSQPPPNLVETIPYIVTDRMYAVDAFAEILTAGQTMPILDE